MGVFELRTSETLHNEEKIVAIYIRFDESGDLKIMAPYVHLFTLNESISSGTKFLEDFKEKNL